MTRLSRWCWVVVVLSGCNFVAKLGDPSASANSGINAVDGGRPSDAGSMVVDAGAPGLDAGAIGVDGGAGTLGVDAGSNEIDAGAIDAGSMGADASVPADAGEPLPDAGTVADAGLDAGPVDAGLFALTRLDAEARGLLGLAMAVEPGGDRVGVVYYAALGDGGVDAGYALQYVEWREPSAVSAVETIQVVQRVSGISLAFDPLSHEPVATFLGGSATTVGSYWLQSDAMVARRSALSNTWSQVTAASSSVAGMPCSPVDQGELVGLDSAHAFSSAGALYYAFRDGHNGMFPQQDWAASDVEVVSGPNEASLSRQCLTGDHKQAYGGNLRLAIGLNDQPAVIYDQQFSGAGVAGQNVWFQARSSAGVWSQGTQLMSVSNTMTGASLAAGPEGFSVVVTDAATSLLRYIESSNGTQWSVPEDVWGAGTGGWYPSVARNPLAPSEPAIAFYVCSPFAGASSCSQSHDELRVTARIGGSWREATVDVEGGWSPKLGFLADGRRVVVYRTPDALDFFGVANPEAGMLKIAVER